MTVIRLIACFTLASLGASELLTRAEEQDLRIRIRTALFAGGSLPDLLPENHGNFEPEPGITAERISLKTVVALAP